MSYLFAIYGSNNNRELTPVEKDIRSVLVHRLAHEAVEQNMTGFGRTGLDAKFVELAAIHMEQAFVAMTEVGIPDDSIRRIIDQDEITSRAAGEIDMFRLLKRFPGDGATSVHLSIVLERSALLLEAERESAVNKLN